MDDDDILSFKSSEEGKIQKNWMLQMDKYQNVAGYLQPEHVSVHDMTKP